MARLNDILGTLPDGKVEPLSDDGLTAYLRTHYKTDADKDRRQEAALRLDLLRDKGRKHFEKAIEDVFENPQVRSWRKKFVRFAEFQNVTKRIVREISTVYAEPAARTVANEQDNDRYGKLQREVRHDRVMRSVNRLGNLLNHVLVWPDVIDASDGKRAVLRVVTTDKFTVVTHPNDHTRVVGYIVDQIPRGQRVLDTYRHHLVMSDDEFIWLDKNWRLAGRQPHGLGRLPAMLYSREEPDCDAVLDGTSGRDITSAHLAVALLNTMMLKHQKSGTKIPYATGDTSGMARGQAMDEETLIEAPEGVSLNALDLGADPSSYIDAVRAVIKQVAANYGIPESVFDLSYQSTSGFEIELKRSGLREIRRDQILDFRPFERELADLWSVVLAKSGHPLAFSTEGWSINFGEIDVPTEPIAKLDYWKRLEDLDLLNRIQMYISLNPEATWDEALEAVASNQQFRIDRMRDLQGSNAGVFGPQDSAHPPAQGGPTAADDDEPAEDEPAQEAAA